MDEPVVDQIRQATIGNHALGIARFQEEIEAALGRRLTDRRRRIFGIGNVCRGGCGVRVRVGAVQRITSKASYISPRSHEEHEVARRKAGPS